jgi:hypothetical protein
MWIHDNIDIPFDEVIDCTPQLGEPARYYPRYAHYLARQGLPVPRFEVYLRAVCEEAERRQHESVGKTADDFYRRWYEHFGRAEEARILGAPADYVKAAENVDIILAVAREPHS